MLDDSADSGKRTAAIFLDLNEYDGLVSGVSAFVQ